MKYTDSHEWILLKGKVGLIGISQYAQEELGEIVYIELPKVGRKINAGEEIAVLESTKAAADIYSPVSGTIIEVNEALKQDPDLLNRFPEKEGWLLKIELSDLSELDTLLGNQEYYQLISK